MEKTCAAEKNRTTDTMWVEKNIGNCNDRLKQIPVSSAVCLLLTVLCPEL